MSAHPIVFVGEDNTVEIPEKFKDDPRFQKGAALELVPVTENAKAADSLTGDWRRLESLLKDSAFDPNAELEAERRKELESEARWLKS